MTTFPPPSSAIPVIEPLRTRYTQVSMGVSIILTIFVLRNIRSDGSLSSFIGALIVLFTIVHHLVIVTLAFRQRRKLYRPRDIQNLIPVTSRLGVVLSTWALFCCWFALSGIFLFEMGTPGNNTWLYILPPMEASVMFIIALMCNQERMEFLERQRHEPSSSVYFREEDDTYTSMEGP